MKKRTLFLSGVNYKYHLIMLLCFSFLTVNLLEAQKMYWTDYIEGRRTFLRVEDNLPLNISDWGYGVTVGLKSPLGPVSLAYGYNTLTTSWNTNFTFGYTFF